MRSTLSPSHVALALLAFSASTQAAPLNFYSSAQVSGYIDTKYSSPFLGDVSFRLNGANQYKYRSAANPIPSASASYTIAPNEAPGSDPVYDIVTSNGAYGFGYSGNAKAVGTGLHAKISTSQIDSSGQAIKQTPNSNIYAYSQANWGQELYLAPTAQHAAGSYGAILVGITLDGSFSALQGNYSSAYLQLQSSFSDTAGVSYNSSFYVSGSSYDATWTGSATKFKKLLFQYGTAFNLNAYLSTSASGNGSADFFNTGKISSIEVPFGAVLDSGAGQAGLGEPASLYGVVFNSATLNDPNTNWDFGNNGGGFTPNVPVPEPGTWAMMLAGLAAVAGLTRRRRS